MLTYGTIKHRGDIFVTARGIFRSIWLSYSSCREGIKDD